MSNIEEEFEKYNKIVKEEEKKYSKAEVTIRDYNFPHIYLSESEIEEFNKLCSELGIDLKVVSIEDYMNLNPPEKKKEDDDEEEEDEKENMDKKMERIDKVMEYLGNNFIPDQKKEKKIDMETDANFIMNEVNKYIGKKQNRNIDDMSDEESSENKKRDESEKSVNKSENEKGKKSIKKKKKTGKKKDDADDSDYNINESEKILTKKRKNFKNNGDINDNFKICFKKIKETRTAQEEDIANKPIIINEILEKSQLLTPEEFKLFANKKHISTINDDTFSEYDLNRRDVNQLKSILADIKFNSKVSKLADERKESIKRRNERMDIERNAFFERMKNKKLKEQKRNKDTNKIEKNKKIIDNDSDSFSDDDSL